MAAKKNFIADTFKKLGLFHYKEKIITMIEDLSQPLPLWITSPLIGPMVPFLLRVGNNGMSALPAFPPPFPFLSTTGKKQAWNLFVKSETAGYEV